ncbi:MAG: ELM1/GtrOC1 family putative glycosyltransferase [Sphingomicrobium sp.]
MSRNNCTVWLLLGPRPVDNNQALALGEALAMPFTVKTLAYNWLQHLSLRLPPTLVSLNPESSAGLRPPWPDLVVAVGRRSVPAARWIKRESGGRSKIVRIGHPRSQADLFDLIIITRQYAIPEGDNVVLLPVTMSRFVPPPPPSAQEQKWIDALPRPIRLVAVGGPTKYWRLNAEPIVRALAVAEGCAVAMTSRRTPPKLLKRLSEEVEAHPNARLIYGDFPSFSALLGRADEIYVTGDSLSMLSEAVQAGKPVAIIPIERDAKGHRRLGEAPRTSGPDAARRDLRRFWDYLIDAGLAGTLDTGAKSATRIPRPATQAAAAVRKLLGRD